MLDKRYHRNHCDKNFSKIISLVNHFERKTVDYSHKCSQCDKAFQCNSALIVHTRKHTGDKPFKCTVCRKNFSQAFNLKTHMNTHTGEKQFKCNDCGKAFLQKINLKYHLRKHTGEKPYKCNVCNKAFSQISSANSHQKTHNEEINLKCSNCDKDFKQRIDLVYHMRTHKKEKPFQCYHCNKAFLNEDRLAFHIKTHSRKNEFQFSHCDNNLLYKTQITELFKAHSGEKQNDSKAVMHGYKGNMLPEKPIRQNKLQNTIIEAGEKNYNVNHQLTQTKEEILKTKNKNKGDIVVRRTYAYTESNSKAKVMHIESSKKYKVEVQQYPLKSDLKRQFDLNELEKIKTHLKSKKENGERSKEQYSAALTENGGIFKFGSLKNGNLDPQNDITMIENADLKINFDIICHKKISDHLKSNNENNKVKTTKMKDEKEHNENGIIKSSSLNYEEIILSDSDEIEEIILSDEEFETCNSESVLKEEYIADGKKSIDYLHCAIGKAFDWLEESTGGLWKRTPNQIEQDLYDVLELHNLGVFNDKLYSYIYCLDVNYRQLYLLFSGVNKMVLEHALLCKKKYRKCNDIPCNHKENMFCCF